MTEKCVTSGVLFMAETSPVRWNRCKHLDYVQLRRWYKVCQKVPELRRWKQVGTHLLNFKVSYRIHQGCNFAH